MASSRKTSQVSKEERQYSGRKSDTIELDVSEEEENVNESSTASCTPRRISISESVTTEEAESPPAGKGKKRKSWVWLHFHEIAPNSSKCRYCSSSFVVSGTGTMSKHLQTKHSTKIGEKNQSKLDVRGYVVKPFEYDVSSANKAFIEFLVCNNHVFTLGEEPAFRKFISKLQPLYRPLGATAVIRPLRPRLSVMAKDLLAILATSAASKRAFSAGKDVFGSPRMSLNPETVEALVWLRSWYRIIVEVFGYKERIHEFVQ
ncbi:hypothetical protein OUZ56_029561 [Daphnia magna]|uniref:BED-type domain-containing protein n=1 Tax=Daphnia magna TaxID=35525 RepID=A0ABR0B769_9CRUS|nr:hypothetical protein OUZ56_029561 [Daphnia magna]